jgi:hypothetical protein
MFGAVFARSLGALGAVAARHLRTGPDSYFLLSCDPTLVSVLQEHTGPFFCCCFFSPPCAVSPVSCSSVLCPSYSCSVISSLPGRTIGFLHRFLLQVFSPILFLSYQIKHSSFSSLVSCSYDCFLIMLTRCLMKCL